MAGPLDVEDIISKLTVLEKIDLCSGGTFWETLDIPRLGIPKVRTTDGPNGARGQRFFNGPPASCMPCGTSLAASWDVKLLRRAGELLGAEAIAKGAHVSLGPTINMQRSPLGGRGFESYSEDPFLAGTLATAMVNGVQSTGVAACIKHFVCNDQEHERQAVDCVLTERALREIYLMPFMLAQRDAKPLAYMTSYSRVNGIHVSENKRLLDGVLRGEWKFDGYIMSDWFGTYSAAESVNNGLDLEMPGPGRMRGSNLLVSVGNRKVSEHKLNTRVRNLLNLANRVAPLNIPPDAPENSLDTPEIRQTLLDLARSGITLLKHNHHAPSSSSSSQPPSLPLSKSKPLAIIGPSAKISAYSGGGSASLRPTYKTNLFHSITSLYHPNATYTLGCYAFSQIPAISDFPGLDPNTLTCRFYNEPPPPPSTPAASSTQQRTCHDTITGIDSSDMLLVDYRHPKINPELFYMDLSCTVTPSASGLYLFGSSARGTSRVLVNDRLVVDNWTSQRQGATFLGAGTMEERGEMWLEAGQKYQVVCQFGSSLTQKVRKRGATAMRGGGVRLGCTKKIDPDEEIAEAVKVAKETEQVVLMVGLTGEWEAEGFDRPDMKLPGQTDRLVREVVKANPRTVVVVQCGTPVEMPWVGEVRTLVHSGYGGNEVGRAIADVLFGEVCPSGKLPLSWPRKVEDNPAFLNFGSENGRVLYGEDVYMGYRFYDAKKVEPLFEFGFGLSYTKFEVGKGETVRDGETVKVVMEGKNVGDVAGELVAQVYVQQVNPLIRRPPRELKGFDKVMLQPGESRKIEVEMSLKYAASYWDEEADQWIAEKGQFDVLVGQSSRDLEAAGSFSIDKTFWWSGL